MASLGTSGTAESKDGEPVALKKMGIAASAGTALVFIDERATREKEITEYGETLKTVVKALGFEPVLPKDSIDPPIDGVIWSNTAEERARHLINMLNDREIDAIIQVKGGSGAGEVAQLLDEYDKDPDATQKKIAKAWSDSHLGKAPPADFFTPRLPDEYYKDSEGQTHGLPKRDIKHIGFSDVSVINNLLGQRGVARPYYTTNIDMASAEQMEDLRRMLTEEVPVRTYKGMVAANDKPLPTEALAIVATVDLRMSSSAGTGYQFHMGKPSILAVESIDSPDDMGRMLQQAKESGMLENARAIVIGQCGGYGGGFSAVDLSKDNGSLAKFIRESDIPILLTDKSDSFGHASGTVNSFANLADATLTFEPTARHGSAGLYNPQKVSVDHHVDKVTLTITGHAKQETLDEYYTYGRPAAEAGVAEEKAAALPPTPARDGSAVFVDHKTLRMGIGTNAAVDVRCKTLVVCSDPIHLNYIHQSIIQAKTAGLLDEAAGIAVAVPPEKDITDVATALNRIAYGFPPFKEELAPGGVGNFHTEGIPTQFDADRFMATLTRAGLVAEVTPFIEDKKPHPTKKNLSVTVPPGKRDGIIDLARDERYQESWKLREMLDDASARYDMPRVQMIYDEELAKVKEVRSGHLSAEIDGTASSITRAPIISGAGAPAGSAHSSVSKAGKGFAEAATSVEDVDQSTLGRRTPDPTPAKDGEKKEKGMGDK